MDKGEPVFTSDLYANEEEEKEEMRRKAKKRNKQHEYFRNRPMARLGMLIKSRGCARAWMERPGHIARGEDVNAIGKARKKLEEREAKAEKEEQAKLEEQERIAAGLPKPVPPRTKEEQAILDREDERYWRRQLKRDEMGFLKGAYPHWGR